MTAVVALAVVLVLHMACWRVLSSTLRADEPAALVALVGLERALEGLREAVVQDPASPTTFENVRAAKAATAERVHRLIAQNPRPDDTIPVRMFAEVERALLVTRAWEALPEDPAARAAAAAAVARAHAAVRAAAFESQQRALAWTRSLDRTVAWVVRATTALWSLVGVAALVIAVAFLRHRREVSRRLQVTEQALLRSEHEASHDPLTGLANRRSLDAHVATALATARGGAPFALHVLDVDGLKAVNDRWGHAAGDALLSSVAGALAGAVRGADVVARVGGDEFAVVQRDATPHSAAVLAQRLAEAVARTVAVADGAHLTPKVSIGTALYGEDGTSAAALLQTADRRLYGAKWRRRAGAAADVALVGGR
jgi:diguanylate cyclase (GGDEF)-like protein